MENEKKQNLAVAELLTYQGNEILKNPWKLTQDNQRTPSQEEFKKLVTKCRFYYKKDPLTSSTINKLIELGINDLVFAKNGLSDNEFRIFTGIKHDLLRFAEDLALEYLISGLVVPEVSYETKSSSEIKKMGVKKYPSLELPDSMWVRDPCLIEIKNLFLDHPTYFVNIPQSIIDFVKKQNTILDGSENDKLFQEMKLNSPDFVNIILSGQKQMILDNPLIIRRRVLPDSAYPIPYLNAALDILEHKRNLRKMDFSITTKVISAIMHVKVGSDEYPMTDSEEDQLRLKALKDQLTFRNTTTRDMDSIFQFFTDHTTTLEWVFPDTVALMSDTKYTEVNQEIIFALGFPRTLLSGESERSSSADPEYASIAPVKAMESFRSKILPILQDIVFQVATRNKLANVPDVAFEPVNIHAFVAYFAALSKLYDSGAISRTALARMFGYDFDDQLDIRIKEEKDLKASGIPEFAPAQFSAAPQNSQAPASKASPAKPAGRPVVPATKVNKPAKPAVK